jgi:hypothetical protein
MTLIRADTWRDLWALIHAYWAAQFPAVKEVGCWELSLVAYDTSLMRTQTCATWSWDRDPRSRVWAARPGKVPAAVDTSQAQTKTQ